MLCPAQPIIPPRYQRFPQAILPNLETHSRTGTNLQLIEKKYHFTEAVPIYKSCKSGPDPQLTALQSRDVLESLIHVQ